MAGSNTTIQQPSTQATRRHLWSRRILLIAVIITVGSAGYIILNTVKVRNTTTPVGITAFAKDASISIEQIGAAAKAIGTGTTNVRLGPGTYQVTAATKNSATSKVIEVTNKAGAVFSLEGEQFVPIQRIANYNAQDLFAAPDNNIYFLNKNAGIPYMFPLGNDTARPYNGNLSNVRSMQWLGPAQVISENNKGGWSYTRNVKTTDIQFRGRSPAMISSNAGGALAVVGADKTLGKADSVTAPIEPIGKAKHTTTKANIAPDGSILVYTPRSDSGDPREPTRLFQNGRFTQLPDKLTGISNIAWSPDSKTISYTTNNGSFTYNLTNQRTTQITTGTPTDPRSALWLTPKTLIYAEDGGIWRYNIDRNTSIKLGDLQGHLSVHAPFALAPDGATVYFSTSTKGGRSEGAMYSLVTNYRSMPEREQKSKDRQLEKQAQNPVTYVGINTFVDNGLTPDQTQSIQYAFSQYRETSKPGVEIIRLHDFKIQLKPGPIDTMTFKVDVNGTINKYNGRVDMRDISSVRLFLYDPDTNRQLYDSQPISTQ